MIYRVQSITDGRGPWRRGFTQIWYDNSRTDEQVKKLVAWQDQFVVKKLRRETVPGEHLGCGCASPDQLKLWFTQSEYNWLLRLGYHAVQFDDARIILESDIQCIFARRKPLREDITPFDLYHEELCLH